MKCDKAGYVSDKAQYLDASCWEKIKLYMHLFFLCVLQGICKKQHKAK